MADYIQAPGKPENNPEHSWENQLYMPSAVAEAKTAAMDNAVDVWRLNASSRLQGARSPELFSTNFPQRPPAATGGIYIAPVRMRAAAIPDKAVYD